MKRRGAGLLCFLLLCLPAPGRFSFNDVASMAEARSKQPFHAAASPVAESLLNLTYGEYEAIRFDDNKARWRKDGLPFCLEFFPPGFIHQQMVSIHEIDGDAVKLIPFRPDEFAVGNFNFNFPSNTGFAGFRIECNQAELPEFAAFLDASYFRMIGAGNNYGASARGLAMNTAINGPEEFPVFEQFWIRHPARNDRAITLYALMDSPSLAGAYQFVITPGVTTSAEVKSSLFPREEVKVFGLAPLTSMFLFDENSHPPYQDFRPQVHDSDGLLMHSGQGEWIWRPLAKRKRQTVDEFQDEAPRGFGVLQRDRNFEDYQDLYERFQIRPSIWVHPNGNWGKGAVELVENASDMEVVDNIVAFWVPAVAPLPGSRLDLDYRLDWTTNEVTPPELGHVTATRIGMTPNAPSHLLFVVEFGGNAVESLPASAELSADVSHSKGVSLVTYFLVKDKYNQTWRLVVEIVQPREAAKLRAFLKKGGRRISESWNYTWQP